MTWSDPAVLVNAVANAITAAAVLRASQTLSRTLLELRRLNARAGRELKR
jgi:hypothetical protein